MITVFYMYKGHVTTTKFQRVEDARCFSKVLRVYQAIDASGRRVWL